MPQKENLPTKSVKSLTADTPVQYLRGVGPRLGSLFSSRGIDTVRDLLYFFPRSYEDRTKVSNVETLQEGLKATFSVEVVSSRKIPTRMRGRTLFEVRSKDGEGKPIALKWFHLPRGYDLKFHPGLKILVTGTPKLFMGRPQIVHPEITWGKSVIDLKGDDTDPLHVGRVIPVYTEIDGISTRILRKILWDAFESIQSNLADDLPAVIRQKYGFPDLIQSLRAIHFPSTSEDQDEKIQELLDYRTPHHTRLIFEEFLK